MTVSRSQPSIADRLQHWKDNQPQTEMRLVDATLLQDAINTLRANEAQLASARKALELAEYVSRKDSFTDRERLESARTVICNALQEQPK